MHKVYCICVFFATTGCALASWYWPFGGDNEINAQAPRVSTLVKAASVKMDEAEERYLAGDIGGAIEKYREVLLDLDEVERANPERALTAEFASVRNKRAIASARMSVFGLEEARANAKSVVTTDSSALERVLRGEAPAGAGADDEANSRPSFKRAAEAYKAGDYRRSLAILERLLDQRGSDVALLNLKATCEVSLGETQAAKKTLEAAIRAKPKDYRAYYNLARLLLQFGGNRDAAMRYYSTGRVYGGKPDPEMEAAFK